MSIQSILRAYRHYRHHRRLTLASVALVFLIGVGLLAQAASASDPSLNEQSLNADKFQPVTFSNAAPQTTDTPTSTPTPAAILVGHATRFGGFTSLSEQPISLTLTMGSTEINYPPQNTDASGYFTVSVDTLPSGTYSYRAKSPKYLATAGSVTLSGAPVTQLEIDFRWVGDADNNNAVDMVDFSILRAAFGTSCGDPAYDQRADFNDTCLVNAQDFTLLHGAFGRLGAPPDSPVPPSTGDAFLALQPGSGGSCVAPPNGGTTQLGCTFVLDLMLDMNTAPGGIGQQSYLTFTNSTVRVSRFSTTTVSCIAATIVPFLNGVDNIVFETSLKNVVSNTIGTIDYATGALTNCRGDGHPETQDDGCPDPVNYPPPNPQCCSPFHVGRIPLCAIATGPVTLHWQFSPPSQRNRHTAIVDVNGNMIQDQALFADYTFNVVAPSATLTATATPTRTATPTNTPVIRGHVIWDGRNPQPDPSQVLPISLTMRLSTGGPYIDYPLQTTDASGQFTVSVTGLAAGTYNWRAKGPQFLANSGTITLAGDLITVLEVGSVRTGDANGDNLVSTQDFNILRGSFGKTVGDPGYDARADFNGDNVVNSQDFALLKANFGLSGANPLSIRDP